MWEAVGVAVTILAALGGGLAWVLQKREDSLRRGEVSVWAMEVISALQGLVLLLRLEDGVVGTAEKRALATKIVFETSILVERGRMYFKNCVIDDFGKEKEPAYRGYRPLVLDPIVVGHQIACRYLAASAGNDAQLLAVAEDVTRAFVSLIQCEVGRSKTASADTGSEGSGADLDYLISKLNGPRLPRDCPVPD
jgi:hypothetical protein